MAQESYKHLGLLSGKEEDGYFQMMMKQAADRLISDGHAVEMIPPHFLGKTFQSNGGWVENVFAGDKWAGYAFHFPLGVSGQYVTRTHLIHPDIDYKLPGNWYDAKEEPLYDDITLEKMPTYSIRLPSREEADQIPGLQKEVWGYSDREKASIYPKDLYAQNRGAATRLVAVLENREVVGSQLGFWAHGKTWAGNTDGDKEEKVWIESQILSVRKDQQGGGIATALKWQQAEDARKGGNELIRWTVDPLLLGNAKVNFRHLGAIATDYKRAQYSFTNSQNLVPASRFDITWLLDKERTLRAKGRNLPQNDFEDLSLLDDTEIIYPVAEGFDPN